MLPRISHNLPTHQTLRDGAGLRAPHSASRFWKVTKILVVLFLAIFLFAGVAAVYAQPAAGNQAELNFGLKPVQDTIALASTDIRIIIARIIRAVLGLLGVMAVSLMIWAGYTIMTSGGNEEKVGDAKKWIFAGVIGLTIILMAYSIATFVISQLVVATTS